MQLINMFAIPVAGLQRAAIGMLAAVCIGCGVTPQTDYGKLGLVDVSGLITLDGRALPYAVVTFENPETGQFSYGQTDESGSYTLQLDSEMNGVVPGEKLVRISTTRKILGLNVGEGESNEEGEEEGDGDPGESDSSIELVPEKYNKNSELKVTVSDSKTEFNFDLLSK